MQLWNLISLDVETSDGRKDVMYPHAKCHLFQAYVEFLQEREKNRFIALRTLIEKIEEKETGGRTDKLSAAEKAAEKKRKQKARRKRRSPSSIRCDFYVIASSPRLLLCLSFSLLLPLDPTLIS